MSQPYKTGTQLLDDIQNRRVPDDALGLWWLGQASFVVKGAGTTIFIDPYLQPNPQRLVPPALEPEQVTNADLVLCTHDHLDHVDRKGGAAHVQHRSTKRRSEGGQSAGGGRVGAHQSKIW